MLRMAGSIVLREREMRRDENDDGNSFLTVTIKSPSSEKSKEGPPSALSVNKGRNKAEERDRDPSSYLTDLQDDLEVLEIGDNFDGVSSKKMTSPMEERTNGKSCCRRD